MTFDRGLITVGGRVGDAIMRLKAKAAHDEDVSAALKSLDEKMALTFEEHACYQEQQAAAHAAGKLTTEEAQLIYNALGEGFNRRNGGWSAGVDTATKVVVTKTMGEIMLTRTWQGLNVSRTVLHTSTDALEAEARRRAIEVEREA